MQATMPPGFCGRDPKGIIIQVGVGIKLISNIKDRERFCFSQANVPCHPILCHLNVPFALASTMLFKTQHCYQILRHSSMAVCIYN